MNKYFVGISISELQQWLADDELPVITDRVTHSRSLLDVSSSGSELENLFISLPAFSLDDIAGVLIVEVSGPGKWGADDNPHIRYLKLTDVKRFIPLTDDAKTALSVTWSRLIVLSEAIFEQQFTHFRISRKSILAGTAGNLFANIFIAYGPEEFVAAKFFADSLPRALMAAEHRKLVEIEKLRDRKNDELPETWVERAFGDIKKYDKENKIIIFRKKPNNIRDIAIVGLLFSTVEEIKALTDRFRTIYKRLEGTAKDNEKSLALIYADPELSQLKASFNVYPKDSESISLVTLGLFLRWKQAFHDERSTVNAQSMLNDVNSLVGFVDVELVANALWMMGAYLGMENITPTYRHLHQEKYPALRFAGNEKSLQPVAAWQLKMTMQPAEHKFTSGSVWDSGTAKTPEHESALEINTGGNEAPQLKQQEMKDVPETRQTESEQERAADGVEQSTAKSNSNELSFASDTLVTPKDAQTQQAQQVFQKNNAVTEPLERTTENDLASTKAESCTFEVAKTSAAASNHVADDIQQAAPSSPPVSEGKTETGSVESSQGTSQARRIRKTTQTKQSAGRKKARSGADSAPKTSTTISKTEGVSSAALAKPEGSQGERDGGSESGQDTLFS